MAAQNSQLFHWHFSDLNHSEFHIYSRGLLLVLLFFSLIFTITILFYYAHWACLKRRLSTTTTRDTNTASSLPQTHQSLGLDAATIDSLPVYVHRSVVIANPNVVDLEAIEIECCICLGVFEGEEKVKVLPKCHHTYHSECVDKWLSVQSSCPICRLSLQVIKTL